MFLINTVLRSYKEQYHDRDILPWWTNAQWLREIKSNVNRIANLEISANINFLKMPKDC